MHFTRSIWVMTFSLPRDSGMQQMLAFMLTWRYRETSLQKWVIIFIWCLEKYQLTMQSSVLVTELSSEGSVTVLSLTLTRRRCPPRLLFSYLEHLELVLLSLLIENAFLKGVRNWFASSISFSPRKIDVTKRQCIYEVQKYTQFKYMRTMYMT